MRTSRWIVAILIGTVLVMGFDCRGDHPPEKCDLRVKAKYTDSLKGKFKGELARAKDLTIKSVEISSDSALAIMGYHEPLGPKLPGPKICAVNDSSRAGSVSPDFTDAGVGNLVSKAGSQGSTMVDCVRDQLLLTMWSLYPFEAQDPVTPTPWECDMRQFCMWNMTVNQFEKWRGTPDNVKMDIIATMNAYSMWMGMSGHSGRYIIRNLRFGSENNAPYRSVSITTYRPDLNDPNKLNFVITLND